jgi:hypothetical protein
MVVALGLFHGLKEDKDPLDKIKSLPYMASAEGVGNSSEGVVYYDIDRSYSGYNLITSTEGCRAHLIDMDGVIVHTWNCTGEKVDDVIRHYDRDIPSYIIRKLSEIINRWDIEYIINKAESVIAHGRLSDQPTYMHVAKIFDGCSLAAITTSGRLVVLDKDSKVLIDRMVHAHHDLEILEDKGIMSLTYALDKIEYKGASEYAVTSNITIYDAEGKTRNKIHLLPLFNHRITDAMRMEVIMRKENKSIGSPYPLLYPNSLQILDQDIKGLAPKGSILLSLRDIDTVAIIDDSGDRVLWEYHEGLDHQHHATLLENGNIILFDNGYGRGYSRIIEVDPRNNETVWEYMGSPTETFFSKERGSVQRLRNGNTLITESDRGRVFEITKEGEIVWEYHTPIVKGEHEAPYRLERVNGSGCGLTPLI